MVVRRSPRRGQIRRGQRQFMPVIDEQAPLRRTPPAALLGSSLIPGAYEQQRADVEHDYTDTLARLSGQERNLFRDAGFRGSIDPNTGQVSYSTDPTAMFGHYQTALRGLAENLAGARSDALSRGIGGGGLSMARGNLARFAASQEQADMMHNFMDSAGEIYRNRGQALTDRSRGINQVEGEAQQWWNDNAPPDYGTQQGRPMTPPQNISRAHQHLTRMIKAQYFPRRRRP